MTRKAAPPPSLHQRILADLQGKILSGAWPPGARIATEHELAARYGCSRMTVSSVLGKLGRAGLVERRRKAGTFVLRPQSQAAVLEIHDIKAEVLALGLPYRFELTARTARRSTAAEPGLSTATVAMMRSISRLASAQRANRPAASLPAPWPQ